MKDLIHKHRKEQVNENARMRKTKKNPICKVYRGKHIFKLYEGPDYLGFPTPWWSRLSKKWLGDYKCQCGKKKTVGAAAENKEDLPKTL
jgi:hypothetical protein